MYDGVQRGEAEKIETALMQACWRKLITTGRRSHRIESQFLIGSVYRTVFGSSNADATAVTASKRFEEEEELDYNKIPVYANIYSSEFPF